MSQGHASPLPGASISVPLYGQVLGVLRQRIMDGIYPPAGQLPPEDQLAVQFGVSRATVRQAVGELVRRGMVDRKQGRGTFVVGSDDRRYGERLSGSLIEFIAETNRVTALRAEVERDTQIPARIADRLGLEQPIATVVRRTRAFETQPFAFTINYIPPEYGKLITEAELRKKSLMSLLQSKGVRFGSAQQVIRAEQADIEVCKRLEMDFASPVMYVERLVLTVDQNPVEFVKTWYRADLWEYRVNLKTDDSQEDLRFQLD